MIRTMAALAVLAALGSGSALAAQCTSETLTVEATPVTIGFCLTGPPRSTGTAEIVVPVAASYGSPSHSITQPIELHFLAGERVSRMIESVDLTKLGLSGTLHLTLAYAQGLVRVEGALLTPGAITIK